MSDYKGTFPQAPVGILMALVLRGPRVVTELRTDTADVPTEKVRRWLRQLEGREMVQGLECPGVTGQKLWLITHKGRKYVKQAVRQLLAREEMDDG